MQRARPTRYGEVMGIDSTQPQAFFLLHLLLSPPLDCAPMTDPLVKPERLEEAALQAALDKDAKALLHCLRGFSRKTPTKENLDLSGVGFLLSDDSLWAMAGREALHLAKKTT